MRVRLGRLGTCCSSRAPAIRCLGGVRREEHSFARDFACALDSRAVAPPRCSRTLGWDTPSGAGVLGGPSTSPHQTVGHLGYTGTFPWIDPGRRPGGNTLLTNRVHPSRENNPIRAFRPSFHDELPRRLARF